MLFRSLALHYLFGAHSPDVPEKAADGPFAGTARVTKGLATFSGDVRQSLQGFKGYEVVPVRGFPFIGAKGATVSRAEEVNLLAQKIQEGSKVIRGAGTPYVSYS